MSDQALALPHLAIRDDAREPNQRRPRVVPVGRPERKHATVLFTDVRGSMDLSGSLDPDEWWSTIAALFELMCEGVYRFGGWICAFTGDGVNAVFESPGKLVEHTERACEAALWLRSEIAVLSLELRRERGVDVAVRIGINSGEIVSGTIGDRYHRCYTVTGYAVALAKRMEGLAQPGQIYLTEHTASHLRQGMKLADLGRFQVKGARSPVGVFQLVGSEA